MSFYPPIATINVLPNNHPFRGFLEHVSPFMLPDAVEKHQTMPHTYTLRYFGIKLGCRASERASRLRDDITNHHTVSQCRTHAFGTGDGGNAYLSIVLEGTLSEQLALSIIVDGTESAQREEPEEKLPELTGIRQMISIY